MCFDMFEVFYEINLVIHHLVKLRDSCCHSAWPGVLHNLFFTQVVKPQWCSPLTIYQTSKIAMFFTSFDFNFHTRGCIASVTAVDFRHHPPSHLLSPVTLLSERTCPSCSCRFAKKFQGNVLCCWKRKLLPNVKQLLFFLQYDLPLNLMPSCNSVRSSHSLWHLSQAVLKTAIVVPIFSQNNLQAPSQVLTAS